MGSFRPYDHLKTLIGADYLLSYQGSVAGMLLISHPSTGLI